MAIVTMQTKELRRFQADLERFAAKALPFATRGAINDMAFFGRKAAQVQLGKRLTLRNKWTQKSVRVKKAKQKHIRDQEAKIGAVDEYLARTERGGTERGTGKHGRPIPTRIASGEGRGSSERQRAVRPSLTRRAIRLPSRKGGRSRGQRNLIAVRLVARSSRKLIFMKTARSKGIFKVMGGKRKPRVEMVWNLSKSSVHVPPTPWLKPTVAIVSKAGPSFYLKNLKKQVVRHGLFRK